MFSIKKGLIKAPLIYHIIQFLGVIRYAPKAVAAKATAIAMSSINQLKEQQVLLRLSQQMLSLMGSYEHYARALLPYQGLLC